LITEIEKEQEKREKEQQTEAPVETVVAE